MSYNQQANQDFESAVRRALWRKLLARLRGKSNELLPFDEVRRRLPVRGQHYAGRQEVPIEKIVGSMGRYHDFDRAFLPVQTRTKDRWMSIDRAHYDQVSLPPVELFKIGEIYFVKDGNHRVSVARDRGQAFIDAFVTEIDVPVVLTPELRIDELVMKREYGEFLLQTGLKDQRPQADLETTLPGQYGRLLEHIAVHRWYLGEQRGEEVPIPEAAASWFDHVYQPVIDIVRDEDLLKSFPGSNETDLYLWIMEYQGYLTQASADEQADVSQARAEAAQELVQDYPLRAVKKLVQVLERTALIERLVLRQQLNSFLQHTRLNVLKPGANFETTLPGQYEVLREQIAVHRWYLGEQRQAEVTYGDAVCSWYDNIYSPMVDLIREHMILEAFPNRTETDLYLWVMDSRTYFQEEFGADVPFSEAAEKFPGKRRKRPGIKGWLLKRQRKP